MPGNHGSLQAVGWAIDRPRVYPQGARTVWWATGLYPHDGVVAGHGTGGHSVWLEYAGDQDDRESSSGWRR